VDQKLDDINQPPVLAAAGDGDDDDEAPDLIALDDEDSNKLNEAQNDNKATTSTLPPCPVTIFSGIRKDDTYSIHSEITGPWQTHCSH
jgi:hypothetical protein